MTDIELADAIESVRDQLVEAAGRATGKPVAFEVGDIEMEFTIELRKEVKGGAKVKAWVVEAGADASRTRGDTHRVSFTLKPRNATTNGPWLVGDDDAGDTSAFGESSAFGETSGQGSGSGSADGAAR
ncbi:trypco2 family protein [Streptomyces sp. NPDC059556]|uniref:trypco2 family protein n=1 Tax=Streptomyces sp. NPDC059556 TaxID=3346863 RepID=UPI0036C6638C